MSDELAKEVNVVMAGGPAGESTQPADDDPTWHTPREAIEPPLPLEGLAALTTNNSGRREIIEAIALNTVGLGYDLTVAEGAEESIGDDPEGYLAEQTARLESLWKRDTRLDRPSATSGFYACKFDEEDVGQGYIEVARNRVTGEISGLFHAPASRVRRLRDRSGFVLLPPGKKTNRVKDGTRFYNYGEKVQYNEDGTPKPTLVKGKQWATNELLAFRIYSSESRDYGMPRDVALMGDYAGDRLAGESNISFFQSSGTPPTIIFIQGEEVPGRQGKVTFKVPQDTVERVSNTIKSGDGTLNRVAIIPVPPGTKVSDVKLGEVSDRDIGFTKYRGDNRQRRLSSFRLQPIFVAVSDEGVETAEVQRSITLEQLFTPEATRWETRLSDTILRELTAGQAQIGFKRLEVENDAVKRDGADKMAEVGVITNREYRAAHKMQPIPEADKSETEIEWGGKTWKSADPEPGQVPYGWNDALCTKATPRGAENRQQAGLDERGRNLDDPTLSNRPDQLPSEGDPATVAKGAKVPHVEIRVEQLGEEHRQVVAEATQKALERAMPLVTGALAGIAQATPPDAGQNGSSGG